MLKKIETAAWVVFLSLLAFPIMVVFLLFAFTRVESKALGPGDIN